MPSKLFSSLRSALFGTLSLLATASLAQTTIHVGPGQTYTTIQSGIDAANAGDTVLVAPGTYNENIDFKGKAITVTSSDGATKTIIDGGNKTGVATVTFNNAEGSSSVISGFTIRGGGDSIDGGSGDGGIYIQGALSGQLTGTGPTVRGNVVTGNYCHNIDVEGGIATIFGNEISGVLQTGAQQSLCFMGSGIFLGGTPYLQTSGSAIVGNLIDNNLTGSGISLWAAQNVLILGNTIRNNVSQEPGSAFTSANSTGTVIVQNLIYGNASGCGGALAFEDGGTINNPLILIANNDIVDNVMTTSTVYGSGCRQIAQIYPDPYAYGDGGPGEIIMNNIVSGSTSYPAVNCYLFGQPNEANQSTFEYDDLNNAEGSFFGSNCVDVSGKYGNITADPQFVSRSGDFHLMATSQAIDAGDNSVFAIYKSMTGLDLSVDAGGNPRVQNGSGKGCTIDMGAYEYTGPTSDCTPSQSVSETLKSSLNPATASQSITFTAQLTAPSGVPTGAIQFLDGAALLSTQPVSSTGSVAFTTNSLAVGSHTITANYQPTGNFGAGTASLVEVINGDPTSTALTCQPNTIGIDGTSLFTATVRSTNGTPTGSIAFTDNGTSLATQPLLNGSASYSYTGSTVGTHAITAAYAATGVYGASSSNCTVVVQVLPTVSTLYAAPARSPYGVPVILTANVAPASPPGPSPPTGTVTFLNGATTIATATLANSGQATITTSPFPGSALPGGTDNLTCMYSGSTIYAPSNCNTVPIVVSPVASTLTLSSSANPSPYTHAITVTARLTFNGEAAGAGNAIALGIGSQRVALTTDATGSASYSIGSLTPGSYSVTASFAGTSDLLSSSASLTEVVTPAPTTIILAGTPNPGDLNQPVTFTTTVAAPGIPNPPANGSVTFYDGATSLGSSPLSSTGTANLTARFSTTGVHNITARYSGNLDFATSTSAPFPETITAGDFSIAVSPGSATLSTGQSASFEVNLTSLRGFDQPLALSCVDLPANTTCTFTPASFSNGQGTAKLVLQTSAPHKTAAKSSSATVHAMALSAVAFLLLPGLRRRRRLLAGFSAALLTVALAFGISGCASPHPIIGGTPPGTYQVAVTAATAGSGKTLTHSATVTLIVKSLF